MPSASPFLETILTSWTDRRHDAEREHDARHEHLTTLQQILQDSIAAAAHKRKTDIEELEALGEAGDARWGERLRRLDDWSKHVSHLHGEMSAIDATLQRFRWFAALERKTPRWVILFYRLCARYEARRETENDHMQAWYSLLKAHELELKSFKEKQSTLANPLLVSRGRKQPHVEFIEQQLQAETALGTELQGLRRGMTHFLGRLLRASRFMEEKATAQPALFEIRRRNLEDQWKPVMDRWRLLREEILKDALLYESSRRKLRWIKDAVEEMRCLEDVYRTPPPLWKRLWNSLSIE